MYAALADRLVAAVRQIRDVPIRFLVNTHVHPDHIGGNLSPQRRGRACLSRAAHTDGDSFVHFPLSNVLHLGDVFRTSSYPITDVYNGGSPTGTVAAADLAIQLAGPDTKIIPGHGLAIVGRGAVIEFRNMLVDIRDRVRTMIAEQKTLAEVMAARPTASYDARWGQEATWTATDFIPVVYHELGGLR